jgi:uncharacterized protein
MIIDFHAHVLPPEIKNRRSDYLGRDSAFSQIYAAEKAKIATADDLIAAMDKDGVDISVIVNYAWTTHSFCVLTNDYIMESVARFPKRLIGFCSVSSYTDNQSLKEIERCVKGGIKGVGELRPDTQSYNYLTTGALKPFADLVRENKLIVLTHASEPVGHVYPGKGTATPAILYSFIAALPDVPVVGAHWGGGLPFYTLMPEVRAALENVYYDTAASPFLYRPEIYKHVTELVGADRIIFGSDFPVMSQSRVINEIREAGLSDFDTDAILSLNARHLLGL